MTFEEMIKRYGLPKLAVFHDGQNEKDILVRADTVNVLKDGKVLEVKPLKIYS